MIKPVLDKSLVFINPPPTEKNEIFEFIAEKASLAGYISDKARFVHDLIKREKENHTEMEHHIAIPHTKSPAVLKDGLVILLYNKKIPYSSRKKETVHFIFCIFTNQAGMNYLNILASLAHILKNESFRERLSQAVNPDDVVELILSFEKKRLALKKLSNTENYLIGLMLNHEKDANEGLKLFIELEIINPTLIDTAYGIHQILFDIPFFNQATFSNQGKNHSMMIVGFSSDKAVVETIHATLKRRNIDLDKPGVGVIFSIALASFIGGVDESLE